MNMAAILFLFIFILLQLFARNRGRDERGTMIMRNRSGDEYDWKRMPGSDLLPRDLDSSGQYPPVVANGTQRDRLIIIQDNEAGGRCCGG